MLISVFHGQHGSLLFKKHTDLLWNYLPRPPWKDHPEHPVRQLPCCLLPRKVIAFSSQNDSHTDYDVSPAPSHITFMSVISYCLTHRNSPCRMKQLFWTEQKHNSTQGNDCAIDPGIRILMSGKQWRPGITNKTWVQKKAFPRTPSSYVRGYDATPTSEEPSPGELHCIQNPFAEFSFPIMAATDMPWQSVCALREITINDEKTLYITTACWGIKNIHINILRKFFIANYRK